MPLNDLVVQFFGTDAPTEADFNQKIPEILARKDTLETENEGLREELVELQQKVEAADALKPQIELGEKYLADTREAATLAYKKVKGDKASEAMLKTIEKSDIEQALALKEEFEAEVEKKFPLKCQNCGQTQLSRRSSLEEGYEEEEGADENQGDVSKFKVGGTK